MPTKKVSHKTSRVVEIQEDPDTKECYFVLPQDVIRSLGWTDNDELEWVENSDGSWSLRKVIEKKKNTKKDEGDGK